MTIRSYGRSELAQLYFPMLQPMNAWRCLQEWITLNHELSTKLKLNHELSTKLKAMGYTPHKRILTPAQVKTIVYYLGEP